MTARFSAHQIDIGNYSPGRAYLLMQREWLPMDQVLYREPLSFHGDDVGQFYAQAWLTTHYFFSTRERQAALARYLVALRGSDPRGALQATTGLDVAGLTRELHRYIGPGEISFRRMTRPPGETPPPVTVTSLPRGTDDLMLYQAALSIGISEEQGRTDLPLIRAAAARHPGDPFAQRVLAHAELLYGDPAAADRLLDTLIAAAPHDAELLYFKGLRYLVASEHEDAWEADSHAARIWFGRAHQADENHYQTLYRYAESLRRDPSYASENNLNVLLLAHQLAPQVAPITMNAAALMIGRHDNRLAVALIRPLSADPHNASLAAAARQMLDAAGEASPATPAAPSPPAAPPATPARSH